MKRYIAIITHDSNDKTLHISIYDSEGIDLTVFMQAQVYEKDEVIEKLKNKYKGHIEIVNATID